MFVFFWPWLGLLALVPLLVWGISAKSKSGELRAPTMLFPRGEQVNDLFSSATQTRDFWKIVFRLLVWGIWLSLVLAVMRPQMVSQYAWIQNKGYDLMLVVDISGSMRALDFSTKTQKINRLDVTKQVVGEFAQSRQGDRVGLIVFGQQAYLHVPLTLDTQSVSQMLDNTVPGMAGPATSIGDAVGLAVRNLRERPEGSRVIILLTDGEDTSSTIPPLQAAKLAQQYGIRVYTIGIGQNGAVPYEDEHGQIFMAEMPLDEELLQQIASQTNGAYFKASDAQGLEKIYQEINGLEKSTSETKEHIVRKPLYRYPLMMMGVLFMLLQLLVRVRRRG